MATEPYRQNTDFATLRYGTKQARRGRPEPAGVINTQSLDDLRSRLSG